MYSILIIIGVVFFDQIIKLQILKEVMPYNRIEVIKDFFYITYIENYGIAFGLFKDRSSFFIISISIIVLVLCYFIFKFHKIYIYITCCLALIVGGAIGNLIDRIRLGYVIDYLYFIFFPPVFNFADIAIVCGAIFLSIILLFDKSISI